MARPVLWSEKCDGTLMARIFARNFSMVLVLVYRQAIKCLKVFLAYFAHQRLGVFFSNMACQVSLVETNLLTSLKATLDSFHQMFTSNVPLQVARIVEKLLTISALKWSQISVNLSNVSSLILYPTECLFTKFTFKFSVIVDRFKMLVARVFTVE